MKKRFTALFTALIILAVSVFVCFHAFADDITWSFDAATSTLYINGSGDMNNYEGAYTTPWKDCITSVEKIVIADGVTSLGNNAFSGASSLYSVDIPDTVTKIGVGTFSSCSSLLELTLSSYVVSIGDVSFSKTGNLDKEGFVLNTEAGSYPLFYAVTNGINFSCDSVKSGMHSVNIPSNTGMKAYYPYTSKVDGEFIFFSESKHDTLGYVYDSSFNLIAENDDYDNKYTDNMDECDFSLSVTLEKGKTYYFATEILNPVLNATYPVFIEAVDYYVRGGIYLMADPSGALTDIKLDNVYIDGVEAVNGEYSLHVTHMRYTVELECEGIFFEYTFTPDFGEEYDIPFMCCDLNRDRIVNAKDYAIMKRTNHKYIELFEVFLNYKY
ncbi:MAG: leucine-rich repeat domain-containing protein [Eubacterium sp.]|nr:leucine-rich repeat domain-containing protein [Eubacterium sp.]